MAADPAVLVTALPNPALVVDAHGIVIAANASATLLVGAPLEGRDLEDLIPERLRTRHARLREAFSRAPEPRPMGRDRDLVLLAAGGVEIPVEIGLSMIEVEGGPATLAILVDARERLVRLAALEARAKTDVLTGLANRAAADEDLARRMRARATFCLLAVDIDGLRDANARFGHPGGDLFIRAFARRLRSVLREEDLVARVGGDEFLVAAGASRLAAVQVANRITGASAHPVEIHGEHVRLTASVGIAERRSGDSRASLIARADAALFAAKAAGRCAVGLFDEAEGEPLVLSHLPREPGTEGSPER